MISLEKRIVKIEERNRRVELDKAWETSWVRGISLAVLTYLVVASFLDVINNDKPFLGAAVPVAGYLISTLVLNTIRKLWQH